jgi:2-haloacid dehalogenase
MSAGDLSGVRALVFDVFGTVVDWRGSVIRAGEALGRARGLAVDWPRFADQWRREGYVDAIARIRRGEEPWTDADTLHRRKLDELRPAYGLADLPEEEVADLSRVWHRLEPWPDSVAGLTRLKRRFVISPLSNGNFALLTNMARRGGLPWDCIISADLFRAYKPDPATYLGAAGLLGVAPSELMMVAAHAGDLRAAREHGLRTAFVARPDEWGPGGRADTPPDRVDVAVGSFVELAERMGV